MLQGLVKNKGLLFPLPQNIHFQLLELLLLLFTTLLWNIPLLSDLTALAECYWRTINCAYLKHIIWYIRACACTHQTMTMVKIVSTSITSSNFLLLLGNPSLWSSPASCHPQATHNLLVTANLLAFSKSLYKSRHTVCSLFFFFFFGFFHLVSQFWCFVHVVRLTTN